MNTDERKKLSEAAMETLRREGEFLASQPHAFEVSDAMAASNQGVMARGILHLLYERERLRELCEEVLTIANKKRSTRVQIDDGYYSQIDLGPDSNDQMHLHSISAELDGLEQALPK